MQNPIWCVQSVQAQNDYTLIVTFENGEKKLFDCKPLLEFEVFKPLQNLNFFLQAKSLHSTVVWNEDIDIDPEELYYYGTKL